MFELIAAFFALFSTQEVQPTVPPDAPSAFTGRPVDASEDAIMHVLPNTGDAADSAPRRTLGLYRPSS